ncbi:hypothetical protein GCM10028805_08900 [Spirosoma harenae]
MNHKLVGFFGLIGAPFLGISMHLMSINHPLADSWIIKLAGIFYITGWMASMEGLRQLKATGNHRFGRVIIRLILITLTLANVYNVWELINPNESSVLYFILDMNWPLSNVLMLPVGIAALRARRLQGWGRWIPLAMSFWLPLALLLSKQYGMNSPIMHLTNVYSALMWSLMAITVMNARKQETQPALAL